MTTHIVNARMHRFKDLIAISLDGETIYIPPALAKEIGAQLIAAAHDISIRSFNAEGTYPTTMMAIENIHQPNVVKVEPST